MIRRRHPAGRARVIAFNALVGVTCDRRWPRSQDGYLAAGQQGIAGRRWFGQAAGGCAARSDVPVINTPRWPSARAAALPTRSPLVLTASELTSWSAADLEHVTPEQAGASYVVDGPDTLNSASLSTRT